MAKRTFFRPELRPKPELAPADRMVSNDVMLQVQRSLQRVISDVLSSIDADVLDDIGALWVVDRRGRMRILDADLVVFVPSGNGVCFTLYGGQIITAVQEKALERLHKGWRPQHET